jgi:hypothetical protein
MNNPTFAYYVSVIGDASNEDDDGVQGVYLFEVSYDDLIGTPTLLQEQAAADACLDVFHSKQGIESLEDFSIAVFNPTGELIEQGNHSDVTVTAIYRDKIELVDAPAPVAHQFGEIAAGLPNLQHELKP